MNFKLKSFDIPLNVTRIANVHYFEFVNTYHTISNSHNFHELVYVDKGSIRVQSDHYAGLLLDGQLIIHQPNEEHALECPDGTAPNVIIIGFECFCDALNPFSYTPFTLSSDQKRMLADIIKEGMSVYAPPYDLPYLLDMKKRDEYPFGADQMIKLRLEAFLIMLVRSYQQPSPPEIPEHTNDKLEEIYQYISEHYMEKITLDNICFLFGTNKTSLCLNFKKEYGMTILNFINDLKIKEAKILLRENRMSVTEISNKLGFNSVHYFCRLFKKLTNQSPKEYAATIRSKLDL